MTHPVETQPSLETLVESLDLGVEIFHPGGIAVTHELATLCEIGPETQVLDVASGTGESACYLAERFGCHVVGVDHAPAMVTRARQKAKDRRLEFIRISTGFQQDFNLPPVWNGLLNGP